MCPPLIRGVTWAAVVLLLSACPSGPPVPAPPRDVCAASPGYRAPRVSGPLPSVLSEPSGLAASERNPGVLYLHNDSGDTARLFAVEEDGTLRTVLEVTGVTAVDWEEVAVGPCAEGSCVFIGDIGDNGSVRADCAVYVFAEPDLAEKPATVSVQARRFAFSYPEGPQDAEALLVDPRSGVVHVLTKRADGISDVYAFPPDPSPEAQTVVEKVARLEIPASINPHVTAASAHPCGDRFLLRTYSAVYELRSADPDAGMAGAFNAEWLQTPTPEEFLGEAIAYSRTQAGYFTTSEFERVLQFVPQR